MSATRVPLQHLLTGRSVPFGPNGEPSAIDKRPVDRPLWLGPAGLADDQQADLRHHGGPDKALHHYPAEHYAAWRRAWPGPPCATLRPGGFGENLSTLGLCEADVCIGDRWQLGGALIEVAQARQPCWKLNLRFGLPDMARRVQHSGRTGWYYRVLQAGEVTPQSVLQLLDRPQPAWPLSRILHCLYQDPLDRDTLAAMAALESLAESWRVLARQRLATGRVEDWSRRLATPARSGAL